MQERIGSERLVRLRCPGESEKERRGPIRKPRLPRLDGYSVLSERRCPRVLFARKAESIPNSAYLSPLSCPRLFLAERVLPEERDNGVGDVPHLCTPVTMQEVRGLSIDVAELRSA